MNKLIPTFIELVEIDSPSGQEGKIRKYLLAWLKRKGFKTRIDKTGNLYARRSGSIPTPVFLCAHKDTVEPGRGIKPKLKNGYITSDGTTILGADNKAAIAAILVTVGSALEERPDLDIELLFTVKEETGGGAEYIHSELLTHKQGVIFDYAAPLGQIIVKAPYITNFDILVIGKASHTCFPEKGINSLLPTMDILQKFMPGKYDGGNTYRNTGKVKGGNGINIIPGLFSIQGEIRSLSSKSFIKHKDNLSNIVSLVDKKYPRASIQLSYDGYCAGYKHSTNSKLIKLVTSVLEDQLPDTKAQYVKVFGISDANSLSALGLEVVTISDSVEFPHTTDEKIKIENLEKLSAIIQVLLS